MKPLDPDFRCGMYQGCPWVHILCVVPFDPWFKFYFPLFQINYHPKTKKVKFKPRTKSNHNIHTQALFELQGDVYKTVGGGHSIQFTQVETLKTRSDELTSPGR